MPHDDANWKQMHTNSDGDSAVITGPGGDFTQDPLASRGEAVQPSGFIFLLAVGLAMGGMCIFFAVLNQVWPN